MELNAFNKEKTMIGDELSPYEKAMREAEEAKDLLDLPENEDLYLSSEEYACDGEQLIAGLTILLKYGKISASYEHDIAYFTFPLGMSKEDILQMNRIGFHLENQYWCKF